jgi:hypothetical protein
MSFLHLLISFLSSPFLMELIQQLSSVAILLSTLLGTKAVASHLI